jgi:phage-related protein (TIGR01555 family)
MTSMTSTRGKAARSRKAAAPAPTQRRDGYQNDITGLGTTRDKSTYGDFKAGKRRTTDWLDDLYHYNDIAATIVDAVPDDAMRQGVDLAFEDDAEGKLATAVAGRMRDLGAEEKITEGWAWGRKSGLGAAYMGIEDGRPPEEPLDLERVTAVHFLTVYDKRELRPVEWYQDQLADAKFGQPRLYELVPDAVRIGPMQQTIGFGRCRVHESRLILFGGARTSRRKRLANDDTDHSILQRCVDVLLEFASSWGSVAHMMQSASQFTMGIANMGRMIANDQKQVLEERALIVDFYRSVCRAVPYDKDKESLEYLSQNFAGLDSVIRWLFQRVAGCARTPMTRLFGMSPAGLNATGDSDQANWNATVEAERRKVGKPALETLGRVLAVEQGAKPGIVTVTFPSLWQMSPAETATLRKTVADADHIYIADEVVLPEEIALSRFPPHGWKPDTTIDLEARETMRDAEIKREVDKAENPPAAPPASPPPGTPGGPPRAPAATSTDPTKDAPDGAPVPGGAPEPDDESAPEAK